MNNMETTFYNENSISELTKELTKKDLIKILEITNRAIQCRNKAEYFKLVESASDLFSFEYAHSVMGPRSDSIRSSPRISLMNVSFPQGYLDHYFSKNYNIKDKVVYALLKTFDIQNHVEVHRRYDDSLVYNYNTEWGMSDGFSHIVHDQNFDTIIIFTFSGKHIENVARTRTIIKLILPHFSEAHKRSIGYDGIKSLFYKNTLTKREIEVLNWVKEGKSSWEISVILGVSERTTNFHIENIKKKLNAGNRTHAVAIALSEGVICF